MKDISKLFRKLEKAITKAETSETRKKRIALMAKINELEIAVEEYHNLPIFSTKKKDIEQTAIGNNNKLSIK